MRPGLHLALMLVLPLLHSARSDTDDTDNLHKLAPSSDERNTVLINDPIFKPKKDYRGETNAPAQVTNPDVIPKRERRAADPHAQVPGVLVPQPVQLIGPDGGQLVQPISQMLYSYMVNPFENYINQLRQTPVQYNHQNPVPQAFNPSQRIQVNQPFYHAYSQPAAQQPQFFQAPGQQPFVYHPNFVQQPQYQYQYQKYLNQGQQPQQQFGRPSSTLLYGAPQQDAGFDRGHIEAHPLQIQVDTPTKFRKAQEESTPGLISRGAVESIPITAQVYSGPRDDGLVETRFEEDSNSQSFSRGDVESYPAILKPLPYTTDDYSQQQESIIREGDGYGSYGLAGFRQSVESPPVFTAQHDPAEAYPMPVKANSRPFGQVSESFLYDDRPQSYVPRPDFYSYSNPRVDQTTSEPGYKIVCYYESWSVYRPQPLDFSVGDIDPFACTHLLYSFAGLDETNYTIVSLDPDYDVVTGGYKAVVSLKGQNPELKVMIALGGWNEGGRKYSRMVSSKEYRDKFVKSVVSFLEEHHFDGLDLDWEYPAASDRGGRFSDKENFASLVKELSEEFKPRGWLLSAAVSPARFRVNEGYDVPTLGMYLDFINVMTYDLRGPWDGKADHHSPIASKDSDSWAYKTLNVKDGMKYWAEKGAPRNKLVLGVPFYGRTFTLTQGNEAAPGARASSGGFEGRYTKERGLFAYYEVCQEQRNGGWIKRQDEVGGPYMVKKDQWVGYDDSMYVTKKMDLVRSEGYGGAMIWAIDLDDYLGLCGSRWPLLSAIRSSLADGSPPIPQDVKPIQQPRPDPQPDQGTQPEPAPEPEAEPAPEPEAKPDAEPKPAPTTDTVPATGQEGSTRWPPEGSKESNISPAPEGPTPAPEFVCPGPGYYRQEGRCETYFICSDQLEAFRFSCPSGLVFDLPRKICNWPHNVDCGHGYAPLRKTTCPKDGLFNNPGDCSMYTWCTDGVASHFSCPHGMRFDSLEGVCTSPDQAFCNNKDMAEVLMDNSTVNVRQPVFRQRNADYRVVCFFSNWATNRPGDGEYVPEHVDPSLCSHVLYAFSSLDGSTLLVEPSDIIVDINREFYKRILALKERQPSVKVMMSLGGWVDSRSDKYSRLVRNSTARREFVNFCVRMLTAYGFDGLDLHWLYPACPQMNCNAGYGDDKRNFAVLVSELRTLFDRQSPRLLLSATVAAARGIVSRAYDVPALSRDLDFINVMTYDFHTAQEGMTGHVSPLYKRPEDRHEAQNTAFSLENWVSNGADRAKLVMGIPFYGQTFQLGNAGQTGLNSPVVGPGEAGPNTLQKGMLSYMELCQRVRGSGWQIVRDPSTAIGPYAYRENQWISYDDHTSIESKAKYIRDKGFGGAMAWTIDFDDYLNKCCREPMPLLRTLARELLGVPLRPLRPGGDCSSPAPVVTPPPPVQTTTYSSGKLTRPTPIDWIPSLDPDRPQTRPPPPTASTTTQRSSTFVWTPPPTPPTTPAPTTQRLSTTTTPRTTTWWWSPPPETTKVSTTTPATSTWWWTPPPQTIRTTTSRPAPPTRPPTTRPTTTSPPWQPTTPRPTQPPPAASGPSEGASCNSGEFYPFPGDCSRFLRCNQGELIAAKCAPGLQWNQPKKICDWPNNVDCGAVVAPAAAPPPTPDWTTTRRTTPAPTTTTPATTTWWWQPSTTSRRPPVTAQQRPSTPMAGPCTTGQTSPFPGDCSRFRQCNGGEWVERKCAPGLEWNKAQQLCDWPHLASCTIGTRDTPSPTPSVSVSTEASVTTDIMSMTCSTEGAYMPDVSDCSSYYMCVHGAYQRFTCQTPLQWNRNKNVCDWEKNARCTATGGATPPSDAIAPVGSGTTLPPTTQRPTPTVELEPVASQGGLSGDYMVVCYFTNWAWYRPGIGKYKPDDIDPTICTHIVYGFAVLDYSNLIIKPHDSWADLDNKFYEKVTALRRLGIKVTLAIGGWNDSAGDKYSRLVNDPAARRKFIDHVIPFIEKYGFDGLDLDWEYPRCWQVDCNKGPASDKQAFADWIRELSDAFKPKGLLLSAAVSPSKKVIDEGYDVPALNRYLDWIAVMTYDYHGQWDKKTGHVAPSYNHPDDDIDYFNMDFTIRYWLEKGASKNKIVLGMPMYGQSFTLNNADVNGLNAPARSGGTAGEFTRAKGFLAYYEICDRVRNKGWTVVKDPENRMGPYAYSDNQWVSYDDVDTIRRKSQYIRDLGLAGGMIWALDLDDFRNRCGQGAHPLMNTIKAVLGPSRSAGPVQRPIDIIPSPPTPPQTPIVPPPAPPSSDEYKVVCYFTNWAWYRQGEGKYKPEDIDPSLCTHIIYGFAVLDNSRLLIKPHDTWADFDNKFYEQVTSHKQRGVKVLVAIGGWNDSLGPKYSKLVNDPQARRRFTEHVIEFILKHNFDGLDLDWEYPVCWQVDCKKGPPSDKDAFSAWIMELSAAFKPHGLLLSAAVSPSNKVMDLGYDIPVLSRYLDWIAVMTYDYHGQWDKKTGHVAPMYAHPEDENRFFNTNYTINYWIQGGADRKKIVMGMPMYGQSFTLSQASDNTLNKPSYGGGEAGPYTRARGFLAYYEICYFIKNQDWTVVRDPYGTMGPYAYRGNQWVGFDDVGVIQYKSEYIKRMGLGGGMIWALDLDDFRNRCGCEEHPLLRTINRVLRGYSIPDPGCPVLGGGSPSTLQPFGSSPHEAVPTTTTTTTVPPWMTQWTPAPTTTRTTTRSPWEPPVSTTRAPWLPPNATTEAPWQLPPNTTIRTTSTARPGPAGTGEACEVGEYKTHESDCSKFYQCNQGNFEERKCFPGLHWAKTRCDWPKNTNCASAPSIETPVPLPPGVPSIPPMVVTSTIAPPPAQTTTAVVIAPTKTPYPIVAPDPSGYKVVCYFTNWAWYRQGAGKYKPEDIDPSLCTHIVYGFAVLDGSRLLIKPHDTWADYDNKFYEKVTELKKNGVKVLIAIGGWNDSAGGKYSKLVNSPEARRRFTEHVLEFVLKHNFDGLDLDWEYPKCWQVECDKGPESDKPAFSAWIKELYEAFQPHGLLLSAAVSPSYKVIDAGYDVPALNRYLDWIAVMTYDYHGHWDKKTGHVAPMFHYPESEVPEFNANYTIHYWLQHGADRKKLVMGMPMYGQSFSLASAEDNGYNAKSYGRGEAGEFTRAGGFLAYYEICDRILNQGYTVVRDPQGSIGPYAYKGGQWFGYDDISMIRYKSEYIKQMGLGGGMIWALDLDDFRNRCGCEEHPLLRTINRVLRGYSIPDPGCTI